VIFCENPGTGIHLHPSLVKTRDPQSLAPDQLKVQIFMAMGLGFLIASIGQFVSGITIAFLHGWQLTLRLG